MSCFVHCILASVLLRDLPPSPQCSLHSTHLLPHPSHPPPVLASSLAPSNSMYAVCVCVCARVRQSVLSIVQGLTLTMSSTETMVLPHAMSSSSLQNPRNKNEISQLNVALWVHLRRSTKRPGGKTESIPVKVLGFSCIINIDGPSL